VRRMPADERFGAEEPPALEIDLRLIEQFELAGPRRAHELGLERKARRQPLAKFGLERHTPAAAARLRLVDREVALPSRSSSVLESCGSGRNADADLDANLPRADREAAFREGCAGTLGKLLRAR
jgi:hypothetical protein